MGDFTALRLFYRATTRPGSLRKPVDRWNRQCVLLHLSPSRVHSDKLLVDGFVTQTRRAPHRTANSNVEQPVLYTESCRYVGSAAKRRGRHLDGGIPPEARFHVIWLHSGKKVRFECTGGSIR